MVESTNALDVLQGKIPHWTYQILERKNERSGFRAGCLFFLSRASAGTGAAKGEYTFVEKAQYKITISGIQNIL